MKKHQISKTENPAKHRARATFPVIEGIGAAAAIIGAPKSLLKSAKQKGCKGFIRGGRIDTGIVIPFLFSLLAKGSELPDGIVTAQDWLATEKAKRESIRRQKEENLVIPFAEARKQNAEAWGFVFGELERAYNELPPDFAGRNAVEIGIRLRDFMERMLMDARQKFTGETDGVVKLSVKDVAIRQTLDHRAVEEGVTQEWREFLEWKKKAEAEGKTARRDWCAKRAAAGLPVPDATDAELREHPGLRRTE